MARFGDKECSATSLEVLAGVPRQLLTKFGDFFAGIARIAVEHQGARLQRVFEFFKIESNCLIVIIGTNDVKVQARTHEPSS
jgi:hypothetical protein